MRAPHLPPRWVIAVSAAVAAAILGDSLLYAVLPIVWPHLSLDLRLVGILLAANRFIRPLANPIAGRVMSRWGVRGPLLAAMLASVVSTATYAAGLGFAVLLAGRLLWGVCWSFLRLAGILAALESSGDRRRGYYLGFFNGTTRLGSFAAVFAGGALTDAIGFERTVWLFASISFAGFLLLLPEREARRAGDPGEPALHPSPTSRADDVRVPAAPRRARGVLDACNLLQGMAVSGLVSATLGLWLVEQYGTHVGIGAAVIGVATLNGALLGVRFIADTLGGPLAGHLSDRRGRRLVAATAGATQALAFVLLSLAGPLWRLIASTAALFVAAAALQAALDATAGDLAPPDARARRMSGYATWWDVGAAAGPLAGYFIAPSIGLAWAYRAMALALGVGVVAYVLAIPARPRPSEGR